MLQQRLKGPLHLGARELLLVIAEQRREQDLQRLAVEESLHFLLLLASGRWIVRSTGRERHGGPGAKRGERIVQTGLRVRRHEIQLLCHGVQGLLGRRCCTCHGGSHRCRSRLVGGIDSLHIRGGVYRQRINLTSMLGIDSMVLAACVVGVLTGRTERVEASQGRRGISIQRHSGRHGGSTSNRLRSLTHGNRSARSLWF
mmetsp:Transcript_43899/g.76439  ORF Transcript_43899/g.76439 Transcript_43899/m.76439 type:complete len:200 (+) Transcript_43899:1846-2445(+)